MECTILPICPFGNIKWWSTFLSAEQVVLNGFENYQKQTWRNRYDILGANGKQPLTIPITKESGVRVQTSKVKLYTDAHWKKVHWRSIKSAYGSSPFWIYYSEELENLYQKEYDLLSEFCLHSLNFIKNELDLNAEFNISLTEPTQNQDFSREYKPTKCQYTSPEYLQVFSDRFEFEQNLSVLDLLFNLGPETEEYLMNCD